MSLYAVAHKLKSKMPWLWDFIEWMNSILFGLRYNNRLRRISLPAAPEGYNIIPINNVPVEALVSFFSNQPSEAFKYFNPHPFDSKSIKKLQRNCSFLGYVLIDSANDKIAGYCFNRCFFQGQGYRGRMVDIGYRGRGLGTAMNKILNEVGFGLGLRLFESVSKDNVASYRSALSASRVKVVAEKEGNEVILEILP